MYEEVTYESILERMLEKVPDNMDKREDSMCCCPAGTGSKRQYRASDDPKRQQG